MPSVAPRLLWPRTKRAEEPGSESGDPPENPPDEDPRTAIAEVSRRPGNDKCCDCVGSDPTPWAVVNWGTFVCVRCAAVHRQLGTHVSRVRSTTLDSWTMDDVEFMRVMGNERANGIWEQQVPSRFAKPSTSSDLSKRLAWIKSKYVEQAFFGATDRGVGIAPPEVRTRPSVQVSLEEAASEALARLTSTLGFGNNDGGPSRSLSMSATLRMGSRRPSGIGKGKPGRPPPPVPHSSSFFSRKSATLRMGMWRATISGGT
ncbi:hypothetical protein T492DRAFT_308837 [Pavlovales sp. CCMP2436]|nr:hypothetical protein T492DRAFT_308837 [Pavlovales sp. CCMP2436]